MNSFSLSFVEFERDLAVSLLSTNFISFKALNAMLFGQLQQDEKQKFDSS